MTGSEGHRARMDSDTPRGYGVRGDVRKRLEGQHQAHPDPAVRELLVRAWDEGFSRGFYDVQAGGSLDACESSAENPYWSAS